MKGLQYITALMAVAMVPLATPSPVSAQYLYENDYYEGDIYEDYGWESDWDDYGYGETHSPGIDTVDGVGTGALDDTDGVLDDDDGVYDNEDEIGREDVTGSLAENDIVDVDEHYDTTDNYPDDYHYEYEDDWTDDEGWGIDDDDWWQ